MSEIQQLRLQALSRLCALKNYTESFRTRFLPELEQLGRFQIAFPEKDATRAIKTLEFKVLRAFCHQFPNEEVPWSIIGGTLDDAGGFSPS